MTDARAAARMIHDRADRNRKFCRVMHTCDQASPIFKAIVATGNKEQDLEKKMRGEGGSCNVNASSLTWIAIIHMQQRIVPVNRERVSIYIGQVLTRDTMAH